MSFDFAHGGTWINDRENCQFVAAQYDRAAQGINWKPESKRGWQNEQINVALIVSSIADDEASARVIRGLAGSMDRKRFKLHVYSTEAAVRREKQLFGQTTHVSASNRRASQTFAELGKQQIACWTAPTDGDCVSASRDLANEMIKDQIDVALIDATQADPIAAMIAAWDTAWVKINLCRSTPLYSSGVHCVTYFDAVRFEADREYWQKKGVSTKFILEGVDLDAGVGALPLRAQYGIPEQAVVLATSSADCDKTLTEDFVETIINLLRVHPNAIYLVVGDGELTWQKRKFESAGVAKRVGYAGKRRDMPGFLRIADIYLAEYPAAGSQGVLMAMSVERPVIAMKCGDEAEQSQAATLVGSEGVILGKDPAAYIERVGKMIRDAGYREKLGKMMRTRVEQHFSFAQTARHLEQLCDQLIQSRAETTIERITRRPADPNQPIAQVA